MPFGETKLTQSLGLNSLGTVGQRTHRKLLNPPSVEKALLREANSKPPKFCADLRTQAAQRLQLPPSIPTTHSKA